MNGWGGARAGGGQRANPLAARRGRAGDAETWLQLTPRTRPAPDWPLLDQTDRERAIWLEEWTRPQANEWEERGLIRDVAMYVRLTVEAEQPKASVSVRKLWYSRADALGLTAPGLRMLRWKMPRTEAVAADEPTKALTPSKPRPSVKDRAAQIEAVS